MREGGVDALWPLAGAEVGLVDSEGEGTRFAVAVQHGRGRQAAAEAFGVPVRGRREDPFRAGYEEVAVRDCVGPDLQSEFGGELCEVREGGFGKGH